MFQNTGVNVTEPYHQNVLVIYFPRKVQIHPHPPVKCSSNLFQNLQNAPTLVFLGGIASITLSNSMIKARSISRSNDYGSFINAPFK